MASPHAAHGPEANSHPHAPSASEHQIDPEALAYPDADMIKNVGGKRDEDDASLEKGRAEHSHGGAVAIGDSAIAQILGVAILEFGVLLHRYV